MKKKAKDKKGGLTLMVKPEYNLPYANWPFQWCEKWEVKHLKKHGWKENKEVQYENN